jgi:hypothetical protein
VVSSNKIRRNKVNKYTKGIGNENVHLVIRENLFALGAMPLYWMQQRLFRWPVQVRGATYEGCCEKGKEERPRIKTITAKLRSN